MADELTLDQLIEAYAVVLEKAKEIDPVNGVAMLMRKLCQEDLFFLLYWVLGRKDMHHEWVYRRCEEVRKNPNGYLDLWSREHYKSSIVTYGLTIQSILNDPEITAVIFSFNRPIAKSFLRQIKQEFETNIVLKGLFPDVLYDNPQKDSPKWSEDDGIIVRRKTNPHESTLEAYGLVDGSPVSKHYKLMVYDDVVTQDSVSTPEMSKKVTMAWENSQNLAAGDAVQRHVGTRWSYYDTYKDIMDKGAVIPRIYPATDNGKADGKPVFWSDALLKKKRQNMGVYVFNAQCLMNPDPDSEQGFKKEWLQYWPASQYQGLNLYLIVDPASSKKKNSDYSVFLVIGVGADQNYYLVTMVRDRLNLTERANVLFALQRQYHPRVIGYEEYAMQADIQHFEDRMNRENYRFGIVPLKGKTKKEDRIKKLVPLFENKRLYIPETCVRTNYEHKQEDLIKIFVQEEYLSFPFSVHDDVLDCMARILDEDLGVSFPDHSETLIGSTPEDLEFFSKLHGAQSDYNPLTFGLAG
jgi:predicted phage terminase large subunit-like protein